MLLLSINVCSSPCCNGNVYPDLQGRLGRAKGTVREKGSHSRASLLSQQQKELKRLQPWEDYEKKSVKVHASVRMLGLFVCFFLFVFFKIRL